MDDNAFHVRDDRRTQPTLSFRRRQGEIVFHDFEAPAIKEAIPILTAASGMLPTWLHKLRVYMRCLDGDSLASCTPNSDYGTARIDVDNGWLNHTQRERIEFIAHEFAHIILAPIQSEAFTLARSAAPQPGPSEYPEEPLPIRIVREKIERSVCDLAHILADWIEDRMIEAESDRVRTPAPPAPCISGAAVMHEQDPQP